MPWVLFVGLTAAAFCTWLVLVRRVATAPVADVQRTPRQPRLHAQILFACRDDDVVTLDCVAVPAGLPFTIVAELPTSQAWASVAASDVLAQWAADGRALAVDIVDGAAGAAVRISDDDTRLQLGIAA